MYIKGNGLTISNKKRTYKKEKQNLSFIGSAGGSMVSTDIFSLDSLYKTAELLHDKDKYILKFQFEDDTLYSVTNISKTIELNKDNFFPTKVTRSYSIHGQKGVHQLVLSNIKINNEVVKIIEDYKNDIKDFELILPKKNRINKILHNCFPVFNLPTLINENQNVSLTPGELILIDFWEIWCSPCIKSLSKVEQLHKKYSDHLKVVGIITEDKENAVKLIKEKKITFINLIGNKELLKRYGVRQYPTYFLIDGKGIVQKEYFGFSEQIEKDIKEIISNRKK
jgi:thiol-disulfide isomerase/thioredoxin